MKKLKLSVETGQVHSSSDGGNSYHRRNEQVLQSRRFF